MERRQFLFWLSLTLGHQYAYGLSQLAGATEADCLTFACFIKTPSEKKRMVFFAQLAEHRFTQVKTPSLPHSFELNPRSGQLLGIPKYKNHLLAFDPKNKTLIAPVDFSQAGFSFYGHMQLVKDRTKYVSSVLLNDIHPQTKRNIPALAIIDAKTMKTEKIIDLGKAVTHATDIHDLKRLGHSNRFLVCTSPDLCVFDYDTGAVYKLNYEQAITPKVLYSHIAEYATDQFVISELVGDFASGDQEKVRRHTGYATLFSGKTQKLRRIDTITTAQKDCAGYFHLLYDQQYRRGLFSNFHRDETAVFEFTSSGVAKKIKSFFDPGISGGVISGDHKHYVFNSFAGLLWVNRKTLEIDPVKSKADPLSIFYKEMLAHKGQDIRFTHPLKI